MKIPTPPPISLWPRTKTGVMDVAHDWYDEQRVLVNEAAIARVNLPPIAPGADTTMSAGTMGMEWTDNVALSLALNSINYQFWDTDDQGAFTRYERNGVVGALGMRQAFEEAWNNPQSPIRQALLGQPLTTRDVRAVFGDIPAAESRVAVLNEVLSPALRVVARDILRQIETTGAITTELAAQLADAFPIAYGDPVLKKAQLAISEVWVKMQEAGQNVSCDLTAFADYQIPNILRALGVLDYAPDLAATIDSQKLIPYDSHDERAIRGASLLAVDLLAARAGVPVAAVDHYLWTRRKEAQTPFHLTKTTAY